ncbi:MAG: hypothetical protein QXJ06_03820 [Candidatus Aenigmatarchaeota archaeon]
MLLEPRSDLREMYARKFGVSLTDILVAPVIVPRMIAAYKRIS